MALIVLCTGGGKCQKSGVM